MNALLVYPRFPITYWGFQYGLRLIRKRASLPPLGLLTVAALPPSHGHVRLVDVNVDALHADNLHWANIVLAGGLLIQARSMQEVIARAVAFQLPVLSQRRRPLWQLLVTAMSRGRRLLYQAVAHAVQGGHLILHARVHVVPRMERTLAEIQARIELGPRPLAYDLSAPRAATAFAGLRRAGLVRLPASRRAQPLPLSTLSGGKNR